LYVTLFLVFSMKQMVARTSMFLVALALASACGSDDGSEDSSVLDSDLEDDASSVCPPTTLPFTTGPAGLTAKNEAQSLQVRLDDANHEPPVRNYNTWEIAITDLAGAPLPDAQVTWACAWMPAHAHGTNPKAIEKLPDGRISVVKQNLSMSGGWQVRLWVDPTGTAAPFSGGSGTRNPNACTAPSNETANITFDVCVPRTSGDE
jgi:hypothetical protein